MREFNKWLDKQPVTTTNIEVINAEDKMARKAWRAALGWILYQCCPKTPDTIIEIDIKQELEDDNEDDYES